MKKINGAIMDDIVSLSCTHIAKNNIPGTPNGNGRFEKYVDFYPTSGKFGDIFKIVGHYAWSPITFKENYRRAVNFKQSDLIGLDFDDGAMTLKQACEWVLDNDFAAFIGTTKSHQIVKDRKVNDRFRIILRTSTTCRDVETYEHTLKLITKDTKADKSCKDAARFFYPCVKQELLNPGKNRLNWVEPAFNETASYKNIIARVAAKSEWRDETKIPPPIWGHILWGCRPPGRHKLCYILGAHLGLRGFTVDEIVKLLVKNKSPLLQIGIHDVTRAIRNGSDKANADTEPGGPVY